MDAFLLTILLFSYYSVVGLAAVSLCPTGLKPTQENLIAPAIGLSLTLVPIFWLNRAGFPVSQFGEA
ncbi:MAG: hypothetical protein V4490_05885, partial [Pseudomonadota bacterium]